MGELDSQGVVTGAVQVPPDGDPVILMPDHATLGGYPVLAVVASADHGRLGQCAPGTRVRLVPVDLADGAPGRPDRPPRPGAGGDRALSPGRRLTKRREKRRRRQTSSFTAVPTPMTTTTARSAGAGSASARRAPT